MDSLIFFMDFMEGKTFLAFFMGKFKDRCPPWELGSSHYTFDPVPVFSSL